MRQELYELVSNTIVYKYELPNNTIGIDKSIFSTENDKCYASDDDESFAKIIYNSIVEYSFNEFDIQGKDYSKLHAIALKTKLKYNENANERAKISYGFHGETILYCMLYVKMNAKPVISRGYFYNPLEASETKGYDSYHLIENNGITELWFGEVKFRNSYRSGIDSSLANIYKALSDEYLSNNFLAITNFKNQLNISGSKIETIIHQWETAPDINIIEEINRHNIKLIYPIILLYKKSRKGYDNSIERAINYIKDTYLTSPFDISVPYTIYFIFLPVENVRDIKQTVIEWIELKKPLL